MFIFIRGFTLPYGLYPGLAALVLNACVFIVVSMLTPPRSQEILDRLDKQKSIFAEKY
jgi:hypothetical protein